MELNLSRQRIDRIDDEILALFLERMKISAQIAEYKKENGLPLLNKGREREILSRMMEKAGEMDAFFAYRLFSDIIDMSKARQAELLSDGSTSAAVRVRELLDHEEVIFPKSGLIACQGEEGGNSQEACDRLFPQGNILFVKNFDAVFSAVESGLCRFGVVPIENSSTGSVRKIYNLLREHDFYIVRSIRQWIHNVLLAKAGTKLSDIRTIYAHQQVISQCARFLEEHDNIRVVPCDNTAQASKQVSEDSSSAVIASRQCAELYGLSVLTEDVQDSENNYTRFVCISKKPVLYEGANHISMVVSCAHKPGALHEMLSKPAALGVNMIKLESCPVAGKNFEFVFFLELEASLKEPGILPMLEELERDCQQVWFLGSYTEV